ncbi:hypothetical protein [Thiocapsa sp. UBA6158]|uniref:hypothetical protein n=1 Tax=Thiocapsa sp. UBA6158 TaxID=1947692 RepID=UPI0025FF2823|nr:hypothetical protein [Thiocapsa sp. UBA6158]
MLRDYGYVDARGMGVRCKIVPLLRQHSGVDPEFEATEDYLLVRFWRDVEARARASGRRPTESMPIRSRTAGPFLRT